jgi:hypothetical protein
MEEAEREIRKAALTGQRSGGECGKILRRTPSNTSTAAFVERDGRCDLGSPVEKT